MVNSYCKFLEHLGFNKQDWLCMVHEETIEDIHEMVSNINILYLLVLILLVIKIIH